MTEFVDVFIATSTRASSPITWPVFKLGGSPVSLEAGRLPACQRCGRRMDFLAQIPLEKPIRFSHRFSMAYVFMCQGRYDERGWLSCPTWQPFSGANAVLLQEEVELGPVLALPARYPDYLVAFRREREPKVNTVTYPFEAELAAQVFDMTKVGGVPLWVQTDETPVCPTCGQEMRFVAQLNSALDGPLPADPAQWSQYLFFDFGDAGLGYVFVCDNDCSRSGAFLWQTG